jgi:hypothetical protein
MAPSTYDTTRQYLISIVNNDASNEIIHQLQSFCGIDDNGKCHNKFWYWYFQCSSALVDEAIAMFPLVFVFAYPLGKCLWTHFLLFYVTGQLVKEVFSLPRPQTISPSVPVKVLDKRYATESGFPSTHTSASCLPFVVLHRAHQLYSLSPDCYAGLWLLCGFFSVSVAASRLYLGVHSPLDIAGGYAVAGCMAALYACAGLGESFDFLMYGSRSGPALLALLLVGFVLHYPQPRLWSISCGVASSIFGIWAGFSAALLYCRNFFPRPIQILHYISLAPLLVPGSGSDLAAAGLSRLRVAAIEEELVARRALLEAGVVTGSGAADSWSVLLARAGVALFCALVALEGTKIAAKATLVGLYRLRYCPRCMPAVVDACGDTVPIHKRYCVDIPFK